MAVYEVTATPGGTLITNENRDINMLVCTTGVQALTIAKDGGATPLFKIPAGVSTIAFTMREDLAGSNLYAISAAGMVVQVNTWR